MQKEKSKIVGRVTIIKNIGRKDEQIIVKDKPNLLTNSGRDFFHDQCYVNILQANATIGSNVIALTQDATAPDDADTELTGEITANGLGRSQGAVVHNTDTDTTTITETFTATAVFAAVQKTALFNATTAPVSGIMTHELTFSPIALAINESITVVWTLTLDD